VLPIDDKACEQCVTSIDIPRDALKEVPIDKNSTQKEFKFALVDDIERYHHDSATNLRGAAKEQETEINCSICKATPCACAASTQ
jgi:hypothetical protein